MADSYTLPVRIPEYVMMSSDFSQQEPKITAYVSSDPNMCKAFKEGRDIYATIASLAFHKTYEECLEFHPETGEYQPEGKARRNEAKVIVLGICYGRSVPSIGEQLYGKDDTMSDEDKTKAAQEVYDSVLHAFPNLKKLMQQSQAFARKNGYVETILGRRRHLPDMTLDEFDFEPMAGYVNPDIDPLDLSTLNGEVGIPDWKIQELKKEFSKYRYYGQIVKATKRLYEEGIKVIDNRGKINDAKRQCVNCVDVETEILTVDGWKRYDEISVGEKILSYDLERNEITEDAIEEIHIQEATETEPIQAYHLYTRSFDAVCTKNHRWVMRNFDTQNVAIFETSRILRFHRPRYHILRIAPVKLYENLQMNIPDYCEKLLANQLTSKEILTLGMFNAGECYKYLREHHSQKGAIMLDSEEVADKVQLVSLMAGKVSDKRVAITSYKTKPDKVRWFVSCSAREMNQTARTDMMKKEPVELDKVWCVTTGHGTWIARRNGKYYITGNSIIQGSAADFSKTALINVATDPRWEACGGEILTIVHDEIVAQAPITRWEEASNILREDMEKAGDFLPFPIKCDVTVSYRWYGLEAPCQYPKPETLNFEDEDCCKWVQYHLVELGYDLPVFKDADGNKPRGDAAHGVSGRNSEELQAAIQNYQHRYNIELDNFIEDIQNRVEVGVAE